MRGLSFFSGCVLSILLTFAPATLAQDVSLENLAETLSQKTLAPAPGTAAVESPLFSPSAARKLYELAYELANAPDPTDAQIQQAIVLAEAALRLDGNATYVYPLLLDLASRNPQLDYTDLVTETLNAYVDASADLEITGKAVAYLLQRLNSREERERLLEQLLADLGNKNPTLGSDLATVLGILMAEKPDIDAAGFYLAQAYKNNKYNRRAFEKLAELFPDKLGPELYLEHLRLALRENPVDLDAALRLAQYAERLELYDTAAKAYEYAAQLFQYLYPDRPLPKTIYLPWAISSYNTERNQHLCLQIAQAVRDSGRFDLLVEALAGKAAVKMGDTERATKIFQAAEQKAQQLLRKGPPAGARDPNEPDTQPLAAKQFAWFYCLVLPDPAKALEWANKAYSIEPNSPSAAAVLAYALVMNDQAEWARPLIKNYKPTQLSQLAHAQILIRDGQKDQAVQTLQTVIAKDPGSLAAEYARDLLTQLDAEYVPPIDGQLVLNILTETFGDQLIPSFTPPEKLFTVQFNIRGNKFPYGTQFDGYIAIVNRGTEPLIISDNGLLKGNIRIDAAVTGDIDTKIPNLFARKIRTHHVIEPGQDVLIPVRLVTGQLRKTLLTYPQANLDIEFTLYLDPVADEQGNLRNSLSKIAPIHLLVKRPAIELTGKYLRNRFNLISKGQTGQKIKTAQLFIGLLMEQYAMSNRKPPYRFMYADWMPAMFRNALIHESGLLRNPADNEWLVKLHTMADMIWLPLDHELVSAVAENLNNGKWPVRLIAMYLLGHTQGTRFAKVLSWAAEYDPDPLVREMAKALLGPAAQARSATPAPDAQPQQTPSSPPPQTKP